MSDIAIRAENLSKQYRIGGPQARYPTFRDALTNALKAPFRRAGELLRGQAYGAAGLDETIWALKDVSFEIKRGEVLGIIGRNGAGKSTLLKVLSRITEPTSGYADVYGRVGSLLEVGTGFHPELTGRENVYLNGAILGMKREEMDRKFDEIVAFADIERFIDTPVKHYSSGMHVRLAFAVAAHLEPEILLVDEVLAVGDAAFQKKCLGKMGAVAKEGRTVLFVSHNMGTIENLCGRAILLDEGRIVSDGEVSETVNVYLGRYGFFEESGRVVWCGDERPGSKVMRLREIRIVDDEGQTRGIFKPSENIHIEIEYDLIEPVRGMRVQLQVLNHHGIVAFASTDHDYRDLKEEEGRFVSICTIPGGLLNVGGYVLKVGAGIPGVSILVPHDERIGFTVQGLGNHNSSYPQQWPGVVCPRLRWTVAHLTSDAPDAQQLKNLSSN